MQKRAGEVHEDWHKAAKKPNTKLGTPAGASGPDEAEISTCNSGSASSFVVGAISEVSTQVRDLDDLVACELSAEHEALFDIANFPTGAQAAVQKRL